MKGSGTFAAGAQTESDEDKLDIVLGQCDLFFVKKLSQNDIDWADRPEKHQGGFFVPVRERDSGFFPSLSAKMRPAGGKEIREAFLETRWLSTGEIRKSRIVNYTSKGEETHLTGVPHYAFSGLSPASFVVMGRQRSGPPVWLCMTVDANTDEADRLADFFALDGTFRCAVFDLFEMQALEREQVLSFVDILWKEWKDGRFLQFVTPMLGRPDPIAIADKARAEYLRQHGLKNLDPWFLPAPGDAIFEISRQIEYHAFLEWERVALAISIVRAVFGDMPGPVEATEKELFARVFGSYSEVDRLLQSAAQSRRSRAGNSFEKHILTMLSDGLIPNDFQSGDKNGAIDFLLPSAAWTPPPGQRHLVLSAKTTVRERWKQVISEKTAGDVFLMCVDQAVSLSVLAELGKADVYLVVPESFMKVSKRDPGKKITVYQGHPAVMSYRDFFDNVIRPRMSSVWV